jgi:EsV-1-7 cysteine-rich motif
MRFCAFSTAVRHLASESSLARQLTAQIQFFQLYYLLHDLDYNHRADEGLQMQYRSHLIPVNVSAKRASLEKAVSSRAIPPTCSPCSSVSITTSLQFGCRMPSRCQFHGCKKKPYYGIEGDKPKFRYCAEHKLDGMTNLKTSRCEGEDCRKVCVFLYTA